MAKESIKNEGFSMQEKECGIVLKKFATSDHKISVLTNTLGKIALVVFNQGVMRRIQVGTLIEFDHPKKQNNVHTTQQLVIVLTPITQRSDDLIWLHHMLELCYYFVPLHQPLSECFVILKSCLALLPHVDLFSAHLWEIVKKLCLGALLLFLGFFPPEHLERSIIMTKNALFLSVDFQDVQKVEFLSKHLEKFCTIAPADLDSWFLQCIQSHPRINIFKTIHFMYQSSTSVK